MKMPQLRKNNKFLISCSYWTDSITVLLMDRKLRNQVCNVIWTYIPCQMPYWNVGNKLKGHENLEVEIFSCPRWRARNIDPGFSLNLPANDSKSSLPMGREQLSLAWRQCSSFLWAVHLMTKKFLKAYCIAFHVLHLHNCNHTETCPRKVKVAWVYTRKDITCYSKFSKPPKLLNLINKNMDSVHMCTCTLSELCPGGWNITLKWTKKALDLTRYIKKLGSVFNNS